MTDEARPVGGTEKLTPGQRRYLEQIEASRTPAIELAGIRAMVAEGAPRSQTLHYIDRLASLLEAS